MPYDEEFQLAALLHDTGKAIDPDDHTAATLEALEDLVTDRTRWLIEQYMTAQLVLDGTLGVRAKRRLRANESYDELILLARCDRDGRQVGVEAPELDETLDSIRELSLTFG